MSTTDLTATDAPSTEATTPEPGLGPAADAQRERLLALRRQLLTEHGTALSPAVARALEMADTYLFLALGYVGYTEELFPGQLPGPERES